MDRLERFEIRGLGLVFYCCGSVGMWFGRENFIFWYDLIGFFI